MRGRGAAHAPRGASLVILTTGRDDHRGRGAAFPPGPPVYAIKEPEILRLP